MCQVELKSGRVKAPAMEPMVSTHTRNAMRDVMSAWSYGGLTSTQGLTLVHYSAQCKHILWDPMGLWLDLLTISCLG